MKLWPRSPTRSTPENPASNWVPLRIVARGICCAVGHTAPAATAALNARLNHFRETEFVAQGSVPIIGGALFNVTAWGVERLKCMLHSVIAEALANLPPIDTSSIAIFLIAAEPLRPGMPRNSLADALTEMVDGTQGPDGPFHVQSRFCDYGKAGIARAIGEAASVLATRNAPEYVLLAAVDSLLDAAAIEQFLAEERIATDANADGFIPAEGAAAVLLSRADAQVPALWIESAATAQEDWRLGSDIPLRAQGLTDAMQRAAHAAGTQIAALDFHASGMTGEGWYAKEINLALSRCMERKKPEFAHLMVASSIGETGAASPVLTLAWLADIMGRATGSPGHAGLLHFAGDDGQRSALVVRYRPQSRPTV